MSNLLSWAAKWKLSYEAVRELQLTLGLYTPPLDVTDPGQGKSEAWVQSIVRLEASRVGVQLFRNNVGVLEDKTGRPVRYGLANDSAALNKVIKSADLIGWRPLRIEGWHVGHTVAQFVSREIKEPGWQYTGADREKAQKAWADLVNSQGGDAAFATGEGTL